jgi:thiol-disulfide isomerase/thioredoxin
MKSRLHCLVASLLCLTPWQAEAQTLAVGDDAPPIEVSRYVKGERVDRLEKDRIYVVEFWATWCLSCRTSIPHLTELQRKYKEKGVRFLGVSVFERDSKKVAPFVKEMGDMMDYSVALDVVPEGESGGKGQMVRSWLLASQSGDIPTAFIVKNGKVAWFGRPMLMDQPLEKVISPDYDIAKATSDFREEKAKEKKMQAIIQKIVTLDRSASEKERLAVIDRAIRDNPEFEDVLGYQKYLFMFQAGNKAASAYGNTLVDGALRKDSDALNHVAWMNIDPDSKVDDARRDFQLALKAAIRANDLTRGENGAILDTLALAYFRTGEPFKALEAQEKAIKLLGDDDPGLRDRLKQYRTAVAGKRP